MSTVVRAKIFDGKKAHYRFFHSLSVLLTEMQNGHLDAPLTSKGPDDAYAELDLLFEHGAWVANFKPEEFSKTLAKIRDEAPGKNNYSTATKELRAEIKLWRSNATTEIRALSMGLFS